MKKMDYSYEGPELKNLGRYYIDQDKKARMITFSASGFAVAFEGSELKAEFVATECGHPQGEASLAVVVDDAPFLSAKKIVLNQNDAVYVLAERLPQTRHVVRVYKRTESACSLTGWHRLETDGRFVPLNEKKALKIEYYGDSITAGNGVEGIEGDNDFETRTENALLSYASLAAEKLDADFSIIAIGGYAAYKSPWNTNAPIKSIPEMFSFADCTWSTTPENFIPWDHRLYIPDFVVINLGTNDDEYLLPLQEFEQKKECLAFQKTMKAFIDEIRQRYSGVSIIVTIGMIKVSLVSSLLKEVVSLYPDKVYFHEFSSLSVGGFMANGGHPNAAMHQKAAAELSTLIASLRH